MTVPFWCLLIACLLPYVFGSFSILERQKQLGVIDNKNPRGQQAQLTGRGARAVAAQKNAFEGLAVFVPAVLVAHLAGADPVWSARWAEIFVVARVLHGIFYLIGPRLPALGSVRRGDAGQRRPLRAGGTRRRLGYRAAPRAWCAGTPNHAHPLRPPSAAPAFWSRSCWPRLRQAPPGRSSPSIPGRGRSAWPVRRASSAPRCWRSWCRATAPWRRRPSPTWPLATSWRRASPRATAPLRPSRP